MLEEVIEPFTIDLQRRLRLGHHEAALSLAIGIVLGLYRCRHHDGTGVIAWAEDRLVEAAANALQMAASARRPGRPAELPERLVRDAPGWFAALRQVYR